MPNAQETFRNAGWTIRTVTGPIMGDKDMDEYRRILSAMVLPEMVFAQNRVELVHEASGTVISFNALDALKGWKHEDLPPLQVRVAEASMLAPAGRHPHFCHTLSGRSPATGECRQQEWRKALTQSGACYQETALSPAVPADPAGVRGIPDFVCGAASTVARGKDPAPATTPSAAAVPSVADASYSTATAPDVSGNGADSVADSAGGVGVCVLWQTTTDQIDRGLLMDRDPILFYGEVPLYESDLDDNGVCSLTVKLRVMPRCWLVLLRLWVRVDGSMVRLRETRLFCRHDKPEKRLEVLQRLAGQRHADMDRDGRPHTRHYHYYHHVFPITPKSASSPPTHTKQEVKHCEGSFAELRSRGAPDEGPSYADADSASQVLQAVAPVGLKLLQTRKLQL
ncbi:hypothetical protein VOLCADRAFT_93190 [Volvox carteri f. nagariensis]|uniref:TIP41-like protein n=1 Tax=Volvox carteri f. nagariensis TaxID=3068 RepID=D8U1I8_VOLCA|nr:uncharacterized protein VOLCADRAFT_93190 [Volvox carteri f. nagariensis]EFJ46348.1 hypothetical protein VOLCADRAFT_93190 [Volvox carteri f. nagariensis]|eukprot:XP_002952501.1 hypothetical protein VOLCADRAFT_93190 [Volvox carteri f. nagariensis]